MKKLFLLTAVASLLIGAEVSQAKSVNTTSISTVKIEGTPIGIASIEGYGTFYLYGSDRSFQIKDSKGKVLKATVNFVDDGCGGYWAISKVIVDGKTLGVNFQL